MANKIVTTDKQAQSPFDGIRQVDADGNEYWLATELLALLGYSIGTAARRRTERIIETVDRAIAACVNSGNNENDHFRKVVEMAQIGGSEATRQVVRDCELSRLACYLVAMNGDPRKPEVASAQSYFAIKTREAEVAEQVLPPRQLPPIRDAIQYLEAAKEIESFADPILRSLLNQRLMEDLGHKTLPGTDRVEQVILTVRAAELGYPQSQIGSGSQLGKFVGRLINPVGKTQHGKYKVNVYECCKELDDCIHAFFR